MCKSLLLIIVYAFGIVSCSNNPNSAPETVDIEAAKKWAERYVDKSRTPSLQERMESELNTPSGEWIYRNGEKFCKGFLTRRHDEDFCASEIPDGWEAFEFDGRTYYVQPLAELKD